MNNSNDITAHEVKLTKGTEYSDSCMLKLNL